MAISELIQGITAKIAQIAQLLANAANVTAIMAERDEAKAGLESVDAQLSALLTPVPPQQ